MDRYRHSPAIVEAYQWTGSTPETRRAVREWVTANIDERGDGLQIETQQGWLTVSPGDWIVKGVRGEFWLCEDASFSCLYAPVGPRVILPDGIPRRCRIDLMVPAELAIRNAMLAVEEAGADVLLTGAVVMLSQAQEMVADYVDKKAADA